MQLIVNGEPRQVENTATVADFVAEMQVDTRRIAVERNQCIVPRSAYAATTLMDGDRIEIVQFIGGG